jgi:hypothetical protein
MDSKYRWALWTWAVFIPRDQALAYPHRFDSLRMAVGVDRLAAVESAIMEPARWMGGVGLCMLALAGVMAILAITAAWALNSDSHRCPSCARRLPPSAGGRLILQSGRANGG